MERFDYPATGTPTLSWVPTRDSNWENPDESIDLGVVMDRSAGNQSYFYDEGIEALTLSKVYAQMPAADKAGFLAFIRGVAGARFKFTDHLAVAHVVNFSNYDIAFTAHVQERWSWEVSMSEIL